ncbi:SMI1/KNR4 family protein [Micromonospora okii]|uniref:SMI1/KNR4 family protein n=1 Tax=Micromonospora okii TaxID=1182970 RepID=UPI001E307C84|nr:SMI1/KNR4 family protein [Micromonospora okii]
MTAHDWSDVRERLARLAAAPAAGEVFGAGGHGFTVAPPLTPAEVAELEAQFGVELPAEYRSFLLDVGCGGAGPAYGLFPARRVDGRWGWEGDGADMTTPESLARPFPHTAAFNQAEALPEMPEEDDFASPEEYEAAEEAWWERHDAIMYDEAHFTGLLYLCHHGCALRDALVVTGPARGTMWSDGTADESGLEPLLAEDGTPLGFAGWYRRWLDDADRRVPRP